VLGFCDFDNGKVPLVLCLSSYKKTNNETRRARNPGSSSKDFPGFILSWVLDEIFVYGNARDRLLKSPGT
jgi:hypothetical protein